MNCTECEDLILDQIDGRLDARIQPLLERHVSECGSCLAFRVAQTEIDRTLLQAPRPDRSSRLPAKVLAEIDIAHEDSFRLIRIGFFVELAGLAAVALAGAFIVQHWFPRLLLGGPWVVAAAILCVGAWLTLADPPTPSA